MPQRGRVLVAGCAKRDERLLVRMLGLRQPALLVECVGELDEHDRTRWASVGELERSPIRGFGRGHVEVHRAVAGENEEAGKPQLELRALASPAARASSSACS